MKRKQEKRKKKIRKRRVVIERERGGEKTEERKKGKERGKIEERCDDIRKVEASMGNREKRREEIEN